MVISRDGWNVMTYVLEVGLLARYERHDEQCLLVDVVAGWKDFGEILNEVFDKI
jgi:hypothetical protein